MSLIQTVPWIPVTVAVVWLATRFPVTRDRWKRTLWIHLAALPVVTFVANVLVVLGFWISSGSWDSVGALLSLMEPIMIVVLGVIVGGMIVAMYLPIFGMINAVQ